MEEAFARTRAVVNQLDPIGVLDDFPEDEYDSEVEHIVATGPGITADDVLTIFREWFESHDLLTSADAERIAVAARGGSEDLSAHPLYLEAQQLVGPELGFTLNAADQGIRVDIADGQGSIRWPNYATGPTPLLALLGGEQRYRAEELGRGAAPGSSYAEKATERLRRWHHTKMTHLLSWYPPMTGTEQHYVPHAVFRIGRLNDNLHSAGTP